MLKKFFRTFILFTFIFGFTLILNTDRHPFKLVTEGFSFSKDWFPFQDNSKFERLNKVLYLIQESYVDPERVNFANMYDGAINLISSNIAKVAIEHPNKDKTVISINGKKKEFHSKLDTMFGLRGSLNDSIKFIQDNVQPDYTPSQLEEMAIEGVLDTLDPHSTFLSNELYSEMQVGTSGKFGGLGIVIGIRDTKLTVISPIDDTPASKAGILPGDHIIKIESESTIGMALSDAVDRMRGDKGSPITISIERKGWVEPKDFHLVRDIIRVESAEGGLLPNDIGYVKLKNFQEDTTKQLKKVLGQLTEKTPKGLKGLILDLRYNPGGLLDQAIDVSDLFLEQGTIVTTVGLKNKVRDSQMADLKNTQPMYPMVVVVNEGSASASEIVAGALQRNQRAIVLGQKTFGKGTVQTLYDLPQKSALKLTVAKYLTPGDISIQSIGIAPDVQTVPVIADEEQITYFYSEEEHGEAELERHFANDQKQTLKMEPAVSVAYLFQKPKEEDLEKEYSFSRLSAEGKQKRLLTDFETRIAYEILTQTTGSSQKQLIEAAKKDIDVVAKTQDQQIAVAMQKLGIDWSIAPKSSKKENCKTPDVSFMVVPAPKETVVRAGDKIEVQAIMKNDSNCTLYQAKATSKSDSGFFDHREVFFGKLAPNQSVARKIPLALPKYLPVGLYKMDFKFEESHGVAPKNQNILISVLPTKHPMYSFHYQINDQVPDQKGFLSTNTPERGEKFYLEMKVKNISDVASKETFVSIKQDGIKTLTLDKGREKIDQMLPGQEKTVKFLVEVPQKFDAPSFALNIGVADMDYQVFIQKKINVKLFQARIAEPKDEKAVQYFQEPEITINNMNGILKEHTKTAIIEGLLRDDVAVQDMYIMVNNKKVLYHAFQNKNKMENFSFSVPLKKGKNDVIVVARDDQDLVQTFTLNILGQ